MSMDRLNKIINEISTKKIKKAKKDNYGRQVVLTLHDVNKDKYTVASLRHFVEQLCDEIGMQRGPMYTWGNNKELGKLRNPKADGLSVIQFLYESSIVVHAPDEIGKIFVTVFSCKEFDPQKVKKFTMDWFGGKFIKMHNFIME